MDQNSSQRFRLKHNTPQSRRAFWIYVLLFMATWTLWVYLLYPRLRWLGEESLSYALGNIAIRLLVWVLPVLLFLRFVDRVDPFEYLQLRRNSLRGLLVALVFSLLNFFLSVSQFGWPQHAARLTWNNILSTSLLIGIVEEIPFRGFIFKKLNESYSLVVAAFLSALLFLAIHMPGWISLHLFTVHNAIFVFVFGLLMVLVFRLAKSLWGPIVAHSLNDFMASVIFRL